MQETKAKKSEDRVSEMPAAMEAYLISLLSWQVK
jgi:hypothetical protein